ncbi:MAG TPA: serine hydrolase [Xanthomonadales bacterium]|nr:serine hydrolase [Xanthomonadales bacterium]
MRSRINFSSFLLATMVATAQAQAPFVDPSRDAGYLGSPDNILFWTPEQQVAGYRNMERLVPVRKVQAGDHPLVLPEKPLDLGPVELAGQSGGMNIEQYLEQQSVAGLLVIKNGAIVYERYRLGNNRHSLWLSYSVTKSVTSMLVGAAIQDGYIKSVDEPVTDYLPRLKGTAYDKVSIRDILQMASGVEWNETYSDPEADINQVTWETLSLYDYLAAKPASGKPGINFNYNTAETNLVGTLLRSAIGNNLSTYLEQKIWQPFGMEADASWNLTEPGGGEFGGCCLNASLRDYGRLGLFALNNGQLPRGERVLPEGWMHESITPSKGSSRYGYLWWLGKNGVFEASGIFGQGILVNPQENLVIAIQSARPDASKEEDWALQSELYKAIAGALRE